MRRPERHDEFAAGRWRDRLSVIGLVALAANLIFRLIVDGLDAWPYALIGAALMSLWIVFLVRRRRRNDARDTGAEPDDVPAMERRILKGGPPPEDPRRRQALAALVDSRQRRLRRNRWWAFPLLALIFFGTSILWFVSGSVTAGSWSLALAVVAMGWLTWFNLRFDRRLSQMRSRLQS
ncbi:LPXTG cell wall anchor domain-containing protein [Streptomyces sp. NPDC096094]|uniref:LPXTG cell wall anchor domain-containing protein n=1 Tax=unclassified Streptomyces TaxID=2593676 RepID=UPI00382EBF2F